MINNPVSLTRINQNLLFAVLITGIFYFARAFLIPLTFAILFSMLMAPLSNKLEKKGVNRILSVTLCVLILLVVLVSIGLIIGLQFAAFVEDLPQIKTKAERLFSSAKDFIFQEFNIPGEKQEQFIKEQSKSMDQSFGKILTSILNILASIPASIALILVYTFLLLFHRERYESFFLRIFRDEERSFIKALLDKIMTVSQKYLKGRTISILILSVLYSVGLLIIGIKYAILLGCIAALLTIIPYVGTLLGGLFPFLMAVVNEDSWTPALWVGGLIIFIQAFDNYFIEPYVIGGEVNLSALATILAIIAGGFIWGVAGMFLFIPLLGIVKIIFDNVEKLRPLGFIISDPDKPNRAIRKTSSGKAK